MRQISSCSLAQTSLNCDIQKGNYSAIVLHFSGNNNAGKTVDLTKFGRLRLLRDSSDICNIDVQDLGNINNAEHGFIKSDSVVSGAFDIQVRYDFAKPNDLSNVIRFTQTNGQLNFNFNTSAMTEFVLNGTLTVYGIVAKGVERYVRCFFDASQTLGDVGSIISPVLRYDNIDSVYFRTKSDLSYIQIQKDNYSLVNASSDALLGDTEYTYSLESAVTFILKKLNPTQETAEVISNTIQLYLTSAKSGGGTTTILYEQIKFDANKTAQSIASYNTFKSTKLNQDKSVQAVVNVIKNPATANVVVKQAGNSTL